MLSFWGLSPALFAQDGDWWRNNVNWDGAKHYTYYLIQAPAFMGPNGLPVPPVTEGRAAVRSHFSAGGAMHFSSGDKTQNLTAWLSYAPDKARISFELYWVPVEWFQVTHEEKSRRNVFFRDYYNTSATGDLYMQSTLRILHNTRRGWDAALRAGIKTASGSGVGAARFTDTPGYYFDLSAAKSWQWTATRSLRLYAMSGLIVWQTYQPNFPQDDAYLWGAGALWQLGAWSLRHECAGYVGYRNNGDRPVLLRLEALHEMGRYAPFLRLQQGLHNYPYSSVEAGLKLYWDKTQ